MKGRTTLFWIILAAFVGFGLFHVKYKVQTLEDRLNRLNAAIINEQEQTHVLHAEWAYLNRPQRLEKLSRRFLKITTPSTAQIGTIGSLPFRPAELAQIPEASVQARKVGP